MRWLQRWSWSPRKWHPLPGSRAGGNLALSKWQLKQAECPWAIRRDFSFEAVPALLLPPAVFGGLLISLWTYKCLMMVVFQNKIIYMPSVPPFSRTEAIEDYATQCKPVEWQQHFIKSVDGNRLELLEGRINQDSGSNQNGRDVVVLYFQGNASSLPPRLPYLSRIIQAAAQSDVGMGNRLTVRLVALSYRGYGNSSGSASQPGIELDAAAAIDWVLATSSRRSQIVLWGQSIGAGVATVGLFNLCRSNIGLSKMRRIAGLLLETPFVDIKSMLVALYPQRWLPYRYLTPFLRSTWDSKSALDAIGATRPNLRVLLLQAGNDELVPSDNAAILEKVCQSHGIEVRHQAIVGALHTEVMTKPEGRSSIAKFLASFAR